MGGFTSVEGIYLRDKYTLYSRNICLRTCAAEEGGGVVKVLEVRVLQQPGQHHADAAADEADHEGAFLVWEFMGEVVRL